jgi:hypothetical protein
LVAVGQLPAEQVAADVNVEPEQEDGEQLTLLAACVQAPAPLQVPVGPQVAPTTHWPAGAGVLAGIGAQVPRPLMLQA